MAGIGRRDLLAATGIGLASLASVGFAHAAEGRVRRAVAQPSGRAAAVPHHDVRFAVVGLDHNHILSMTAAMRRGGAEPVAVLATATDDLASRQLEGFRARFGDVPVARSVEEILDDARIQLVLGAPIPDQRAALGIRVMQAGKDFLSDKPAVTTLQQLAQVRTEIAATGRRFGIMYSERLEVPAAVKAGELIHAGAIGRVLQTVNLAPHRVGASGRPDWFFDRARTGGILADIGSHQAEQFLFYTGSRRARVVAAQTGNLNHTAYPEFEDFGDLMLVGDGGSGYVRVDWFTPDGLASWGDGRLFVLGTDGYIELRKYIDPAGRRGGNHLLLVDRKETLHLDCSQVELPFGPQFVADVAQRTGTAQDQDMALLAAELVLEAQRVATRPVL